MIIDKEYKIKEKKTGKVIVITTSLTEKEYYNSLDALYGQDGYETLEIRTLEGYKNPDWQVLMQLEHGYTLLYNPNAAIEPYNAAYNYDSKTGVWDSGHYASTLDGALLKYYKYTGNEQLKSDEQLRDEDKYEISYSKMADIATTAISLLKEQVKFNGDDWDLVKEELDLGPVQGSYFNI